MKKIIVFALLLLFTSCKGQKNKAIETISGELYTEKLKQNGTSQLLDVRTPEEYAVEHLENAKNINWNGNDFVAQVQKLDKTKPVFVYCKVGGRSSQAAEKLTELGFKEVYNLDGGIMKWKGKKVSQKTTSTSGLSSDAFTQLTQSAPKVLINFSATWCAPCQKMKPYITKLQTELKDQVTIIRLDADENKSLLESMELDGIPVVILYESGKETWRNIGYISEEDLKKHL